jgi:hypothetical protein
MAQIRLRAHPQQHPSALVIVGATLIDGNGGVPLKDAVIVLRGNKIESVSQNGGGPIPADATVIHAEGKFVLPGLIDAHLHYSGMMAELLLNHGVTTAFDIAGLDLHQVVRRDAIDRGRMVGPRLFVPVDSVLAPTEPGHGPCSAVGAQLCPPSADTSTCRMLPFPDQASPEIS